MSLSEHGCFISLVLEREVLATVQRELGGLGRSRARGGVPESRAPTQCLSAGPGYIRGQDIFRKVGRKHVFVVLLNFVLDEYLHFLNEVLKRNEKKGGGISQLMKVSRLAGAVS